ncbi:MCE family protein [Nocardia sp. BSTN01]|nr:MCE family protein [Nocardia sp. BSTN01]
MRAIALRLTIFAAAVAVLLVLVVQAIQRPVSGDTISLRALFTDANGLKTGDDIRVYGVAVGKVTAVALDDQQAAVQFTVLRSRPVYTNSVLAIRYQSLAGQRYIDIRQDPNPGERLTDSATIGTEHTVPSFDITQMFNGLKPILDEVSPGSVNKFAENVLAVIQGDGSGIGPALDSIEELSRYAGDRQAVISTIMSNLGEISGQIGGRSPNLVVLLRGIADVFTVFQAKIDGLIDFAEVAPSALGPLNSLMATLGFTENNNPDLRNLFPDPAAAVDMLNKLPGLLQAMAAMIPTPMPSGQPDLTCSKGNADLPGVVRVLIAGQRIAICKS